MIGFLTYESSLEKTGVDSSSQDLVSGTISAGVSPDLKGGWHREAGLVT